MLNENVRWTYVLLKVDGGMDAEYSEGPIHLGRLQDLLGGAPEFIDTADGYTIAARTDRKDLASNKHFPTLTGDLVLGKKLEGVFVGGTGIAMRQTE